MPMVNLKRDPEPKKDSTLCCPTYDEPAYPYGTRIRLCNEELKKLAVDTLPTVGTKLRVMALVEVISVSQNEEQGSEPRRDVELQITDMDLAGADSPRSTTDKLYG